MINQVLHQHDAIVFVSRYINIIETIDFQEVGTSTFILFFTLYFYLLFPNLHLLNDTTNILCLDCMLILIFY